MPMKLFVFALSKLHIFNYKYLYKLILLPNFFQLSTILYVILYIDLNANKGCALKEHKLCVHNYSLEASDVCECVGVYVLHSPL